MGDDYTSPRNLRHVVEHKDGRSCRADKGEWIIETSEVVLRRGNFNPNMNMRCLRAHPVTAKKIDESFNIDWSDKPPVEIDVTDMVTENFGHPGLGIRFAPTPPLPWEFHESPIPKPDTEAPGCGEVKWSIEQDRVLREDPNGAGLVTEAVTPEAQVIMSKVLPALLEKFLQKNRKYAIVQQGHDLGLKGIVPDVNRKSSVIIDRLWHGAEYVDEYTTEVIEDLIGHCLLMLGKIALMEDEDGE